MLEFLSISVSFSITFYISKGEGILVLSNGLEIVTLKDQAIVTMIDR